MKTDRLTYEGVPTPCYIVEEDLLRRNLELIRDVSRRAGVEIILAFKAFALWKSFPVFREYISHTTASSLYEARLAAEEFGSKAHTYSPAYTERDFDRILSCSSHVTFNSMSQYIRFYPRVEEYNRLHPEERVSCGLRINPEYSEIEVDLYNPCAPGSRFGMMASQLPDGLPAGIEGFHCHCHCESSSEALEHTLQHIEEKFGRWLSRLKWLNLGGGHLMTRKDYDVERLSLTAAPEPEGDKQIFHPVVSDSVPGMLFQDGTLSKSLSGYRLQLPFTITDKGLVDDYLKTYCEELDLWGLLDKSTGNVFYDIPTNDFGQATIQIRNSDSEVVGTVWIVEQIG